MKKSFFYIIIAYILINQIMGKVLANLSLTNVYIHPDFSKIKIHDLGVVTFTNESGVKKDISPQVTQRFIEELNKRGYYVIHRLTPEEVNSLQRLADIDALLTGTIIVYRDYEPLKFGIKLTLKDLTTNQTLWSVQEVFDSSRRDVVESIKNYYRSLIDKRHPIIGYKIYLVSMDKFIEFCFNKIIDTL